MKPITRLACSVAAIALGGAELAAQPPQPSDAAQVRAERTAAQMTQDEKIQLIHSTFGVALPQAKRPADMPIGAGAIPGIP
ncbi:MAG TPA: hypothetical protein VN627_06255, partial [Novosphingobium sp.]|nr:hypothetical protein [Novosphingobium sp.]